MAVSDASDQRSRRALLAGLVGALGAGLMRAGRADAATGAPLVLGQDNTANAGTSVTADLPGTGAQTLKVVNTGLSGSGVVVTAIGAAINATGGHGVIGTSNHPNGVGVIGVDATNHPFGRGTAGMSTNGWGVWAVSDHGQALRVEGRAVFRRSGTVTISYPKKAVTVTIPGPALTGPVTGPPATPGSLVLAVLQTNLSGVYVRAAVPAFGTNQITVYLNKAPGSSDSPKTVTVAWFVAN